MRALVLGGGGYLGSLLGLLAKMHRSFDDVRSVDVVGGRFAHDIADLSEDLIHELVHDVDEVFVLASPVGKNLVHDESAMFDLNFRSIARVLAALDKRVVVNFFSSGAVFEGYESVKATVDTWPRPITSYAKYKWLAENFVCRYVSNYRIIRLASCYGWSPTFKSHTLLNSVLGSYVTGVAVEIRAHQSNGVSVTDASYAMERLMEMVVAGSHIRQTVHICQQFLPVSDLVAAIESQCPVSVRFRNEGLPVGGYNLFPGDVQRDLMMGEIAESARFFRVKADSGEVLGLVGR